MNITELIEKMDKNRDKYSGKFNGIIMVENELNEQDLCEVINNIGSAESKYPRIGVVDSENRPVITKADCVVTPSMRAEISKSISFVNGERIVKKATILNIKPDYLVFRNLISEINIEDILWAFRRGIGVISFTNLSKEQFIEANSKSANISAQFKQPLLELINFI